MQSKKLLTRRRLLELRKLVIVTMVFLLSLSNFLPYSAQYAQANETPSLSDLELTQDVDGEERKEVEKGTPFTFNIDALIPESGSNEGTLTILNQVNKQLAIENLEVVVNEEESDLEAVIEEQDVSLELTPEQLDTVAGQHVTLKITAAFQDEVEAGTEIEHVAEAFINGELAEKAEPVTVALLADATSEEEEAPAEEEAQQEEENAGEETSEEGETSEEEQLSEEEQGTKEEAEGEEDAASIAAVEASDVLELNATDSYGTITGSDGKEYIYQFDGNNPSATPKAVIEVQDGLSFDGIGLDLANGVFYGLQGTGIYKISPDGSSTLVTSVTGGFRVVGAGGVSPDGSTFAFNVQNGSQREIRTLDLNTMQVTTLKALSHDIRDLVYDSDGNIYYIRSGDEAFVRLNPETLQEDVIGPFQLEDGSNPITHGSGLSILADGRLLVSDYQGELYVGELGNNLLTPVGKIENNGRIWDLASAAYPEYKPVLETEKFINQEEKTNQVSAGETIEYTLKVTNTGNISSSQTFLKDQLPEGTEYVPGSTTLNGESITDVNEGSPLFSEEGLLIKSPNQTALDGSVFVGEQEAVIVTFKVKVNEDAQVGDVITNIASVSSNEVEEVESDEVTSEVVELPPVDACTNPVALINGSFEQGPTEGGYTNPIYFYEDQVPGWQTTDDSQGVKIIEIWNYERQYPPIVRAFPAPPDGIRYAELNAFDDGLLYQDVETTPGQTIKWRLSHMGRQGVDTMQVRIGQATNDPYDTVVQTQMSSGNTAWETYTGTYTVPAGQTVTRFGFEAVSAVGGIGAGNFLDDIFLGTEPCVEAEKTVSPEGEVTVGDELTYEVTIKNTGGDIAADAVFEDAIPEGTEYVPGSMKILTGPNAGDLTDADDDDAGHFDGDKVIINLGDLPNTTELPDGITVQFKVKTLASHANDVVVNQAHIGYKDLLVDEEKTTDTNEVETPIVYQKPVIESEKNATLLEKADGNTDANNPEVGDTLLYTIQARNTLEGSIVENFVIFDVIPEGLEYVPGTLKVNGEAVTDEEDDDEGHYVGGEAFGSFGDVTNTEWQTLEFQVIVGEGQAGKDIENVAVVDGDNLDEPDEPREEVKIYPREPKLESRKSAQNADENKERYEVGDTVVYTIESRNTVSDSLLENLTITDVLPEGLTFVEGSLEVSHGGTGSFEDGTVTADFGEVADTEWRTVTFEATIDTGYSGETIKNVAVVEVPNIDEPDEPETEIDVDPKEPVLESEKAASLIEKAEGNTDEDNPEVGDTLRYTIQTRNTIEDSLIENLTISDVIPEGLEYVPGTLKVNGEAVTDEEDDDQGHYVDGTVVGQFGNVEDTEWHTLEFDVVVLPGQAGEDIENTAVVDGDNLDEPDRPQEEVKIYPREPKLESRKSATNADESKDGYEVGDTVVYTIEARNTVSDSLFENLTITDQLPEGLTFVEGSLEVSHGGTGSFENGTVTAEFGEVTDTEWRTVTFEATIDSGYVGETIENVALVEVPNIDEPDEPGTEIDVDPKEPKLESEKSAALLEKADGNTDEDNPEVGDTLRYTIQTRNTIEDSLIENLTISDVIPEGLEYVPGTLKVNGEAVTDEEDDDQGHYVDGTVVGHFGNVEDTEWHTLVFDVVVLPGQAGKDIENTAVVDGDNIEDPDEPREDVEIYPREPKLESRKSATNADESKDGYEVGDTVVYTIEARNTVEDSLLENLTITDVLPEGLTFVEGSLEVSHSGTGSYEDGKVTAEFGEVKDTDWRTVTFEATINPGYVGETIENVALVEVPNIDEPDEPGTDIDVDPKEPKLESRKSAQNADESKERYEVGDTVVYTIEARNTVEDSLLENLTITDVLPEGVTFVEGSLEVSHSGTGNFEDGTVTAEFGEVKDTEWRTVTFEATIDAGYVGETIKNVALVEVPNIDEPDEPGTDIDVDPKEPKTESRKSATNADESKDGYEVGDTVVYTIQSRNTVEDSLLENLKISDVLPEGLTFVEGSLEVSHGGTGSYEDGKVTAEFGEVKDTDWRTVTFEATINAGYSGETLKNVALVEVPNIDEPDEPSTDVDVDPKKPKTESEKSAALLEKADGNTDEDNPEVGDTLRYTIQTRNTIEDSLIANLTISDVLPEGLEYVPGTLKVNGEAVTDEEDDDQGHYVDGKVVGHFGNVEDTEWHTLVFDVVVLPGQAGKDIENTAVVDGDNIDDPDEPREDVEIYPREPKLESRKSATNADESKDRYEVGDTVVYTIEARNTVEDSLLENLTITDVLPEGVTFVEGSLEVSHSGTGNFEDGTVTAEFGEVKDTEWRTVTFEATIDAGYVGETIKNVAVVEVPNIDEPDEPSTDVDVDPKQPKLESKKSAKNADESKDGYEVGDTVVYTIEARNTVEDSLVEDLRITDQLPEGLAFVEGSLKVSEGGEGSYEDGTVTAEFGNVEDTEWRTVTFEATIEPGFANKTVKNVATVGGGNIEDPDKPEHEVDVDPKEPKLESKKSAKNADESKDGYEVGDTVVYTIEARNTVEDSAVEDLTIIDQLPEGLAFVEGSLQVSEGGTATFEDGTVTAEFGTITDTEWRTVTFEATIESGTSIKNVATVNGSNIDDPDKPEAEIEITEPPAPPTPGDGDKEDPVDPTPGDKPEEPKPGNGGTNKPQEPTPGDKSPSDGSKLPKTATSTYNLLLIGASLLVLGAILWFLRRKKAA
ncbi:isopeptide-forming domain-containing fimbrial protein [Shouchella clausii]|uniref:isopeptide-forming domain-containing fimbrial protein n=1 Tax=Shouchella clausii TaxID=79880 RepID=UPI0027001017|nr:isopeptide-forming domain-containing fimbrial protein [Shouchella clausii]MDO7269239.1 isopeptide-forming domain-containing fimbrial protein [Shouchella clausii]MDO7289121.1 isopeptide-forming domain-containing fimbrial protein [Shouchella clausii]